MIYRYKNEIIIIIIIIIIINTQPDATDTIKPKGTYTLKVTDLSNCRISHVIRRYK